jgi:hypothetical protein
MTPGGGRRRQTVPTHTSRKIGTVVSIRSLFKRISSDEGASHEARCTRISTGFAGRSARSKFGATGASLAGSSSKR